MGFQSLMPAGILKLVYFVATGLDIETGQLIDGGNFGILRAISPLILFAVIIVISALVIRLFARR